MSDLLTLKCVRCGRPLAAVDLKSALELVPKKLLFAMMGASRVLGKPIDKTRPDLGMTADEISATVDSQCIGECS